MVVPYKSKLRISIYTYVDLWNLELQGMGSVSKTFFFVNSIIQTQNIHSTVV